MSSRGAKFSEALAVAVGIFDKAAERTTPNQQTGAWAVIRTHLEDVAELIAAASLAAEWIDEAHHRKGLPVAITLPRLKAALARVQGGDA